MSNRSFGRVKDGKYTPDVTIPRMAWSLEEKNQGVINLYREHNGNIELYRDNEAGAPQSNLPDKRITERFSFTGIGWGYDGSGPMELAKRMIKFSGNLTRYADQ